MLVFQLRFLYSMGVGGVLVALSAAFVSLTLLPALLAVLGPRVNALGLRRWQVAVHRDAAHVRAGPWYRLSRAVMRRPAPVATAVAALLIVMGLPFLRHRRSRGSMRRCCRGSKTARMVDDAIARRVPARPDVAGRWWWPGRGARAPGRGGLRAAARGPRRRRERERPPSARASSWLLDVVPEGAALSDSAKDLVRDVRALDVPFGAAGRRRDGRVRGPAGVARRLAADRAGDPRDDDARHPVRDDRLGRAPGQGAADEPPDGQRRVRAARADLPGRPARGAARLRIAGCAGGHPAHPAVRDGVRPLHRLRRVPAHADQGGARRRRAASASRSRSASSAPGGSSPTRRCCSASRSARSRRRRSSSSRRSASGRRSRS